MAKDARMVTLMPIRNMDRALRFYTKVLGGKLVYRAEGEMKDDWASISIGDHEVWLITPEKREKRELAYSTFLVRNIRKKVSDLMSKGVKFSRAERSGPETKVEGPIAFETFGAGAFFKDSEGNALMLWQNNPPM